MTERFPPKIRNKARISTSTTPIQHCIGSPSQCNKVRKRNRSQTDWKENPSCAPICHRGIKIDPTITSSVQSMHAKTLVRPTGTEVTFLISFVEECTGKYRQRQARNGVIRGVPSINGRFFPANGPYAYPVTTASRPTRKKRVLKPSHAVGSTLVALPRSKEAPCMTSE